MEGDHAESTQKEMGASDMCKGRKSMWSKIKIDSEPVIPGCILWFWRQRRY